jgi:transposase InsO family protein
MAQRNAALVQRIRELKAEPPFWGYRRIWASLHFVEPQPVNKKRLVRLLREQQPLVTPDRRVRAKRPPTGKKPRPTKPNAWWGLDMTQVLVEGVGWGDIVVVLDGYPKLIVGYDAGLPCTSPPWLAALERAGNRPFPRGVREQGLALMSDHGGQPTSTAFMRACRHLGIQPAFTRENNPTGKADTERVIRTLNEACLWRHDWTGPLPLARALEAGLADDNEQYWHSALGYKPPSPFERDSLISHGTQFTAA